MKKGMAMRVKESIPPKNCWLITLSRERSPRINIPTRAAERRDKKRGNPRTISTRKTISIKKPKSIPPFPEVEENRPGQ